MARMVHDSMMKRVLFHPCAKEINTMKLSTKDQVAGKIH
jgi:hypothetical protein